MGLSNPVDMSSYFSLQMADNGTYTLELFVGVSTQKIGGLKDYQLEGFVGVYFLRRLRGYAHNRIRAFRAHPNERIAEREEAYKQIVYSVDQAKSTDMPRVVLSVAEAMTVLMPSVRSACYQGQSQFVFDLINLANELEQRPGAFRIPPVGPATQETGVGA